MPRSKISEKISERSLDRKFHWLLQATSITEAGEIYGGYLA